MSEKKKTRSDQEWLDLIQECRESGLPDREWCRLHSISAGLTTGSAGGLGKPLQGIFRYRL